MHIDGFICYDIVVDQQCRVCTVSRTLLNTAVETVHGSLFKTKSMMPLNSLTRCISSCVCVSLSVSCCVSLSLAVSHCLSLSISVSALTHFLDMHWLHVTCTGQTSLFKSSAGTMVSGVHWMSKNPARKTDALPLYGANHCHCSMVCSPEIKVRMEFHFRKME